MAFRRTSGRAQPDNSLRGVRQSVPFAFDPDHRPAFLPGVEFRKRHGVLMEKFSAAEAALRVVDCWGLRMEFIVLLDGSTSMQSDYGPGGLVETFLQRLLAFALPLSPSGHVTVIRYDTHVHDPIVINQDNYQNIRHLVGRANGWTNMAAAYRAAIKLARLHKLPTVLANTSDGNPTTGPNTPDNEILTTNAVMDTSSYPIFNKILAVRDVPYLDRLDDMPSRVEIRTYPNGMPMLDSHGNLMLWENPAGRRLIDNVDAKRPGDFSPDPRHCSDINFAEQMVVELNTWIQVAARVGLLTGVPTYRCEYSF